MIKVLNKADLADPEITELWVAHMEQEKGIRALPPDPAGAGED